MNRTQKLLVSLSVFFASPSMAHVSHESTASHFMEHLFMALLIGLPIGYLLLRQLFAQRDN